MWYNTIKFLGGLTMNKTVLVTGASRGIGKAIAYKFMEEGYKLIVTCEKNSELLNVFGDDAIKFTGDFSIYRNVEKLFELLSEKNIFVDILVNNAGISHIGLLQDMSPEEWSRIISVNLNSAFYMAKNVIPMMLNSGAGSIINISSIWGNVGASMEVAYSASKGGLNSFTKALAKELAPSNIQVNAVSCGITDTDMNRCFEKEDLDSIIEEIPAGRMLLPEEISDVVYKLTTTTSYLTGQIISIDGGWQ